MNIADVAKLSEEETRTFIKAYQETEDGDALIALVNYHIHLVLTIMHEEFKNRGEMDDIIIEGKHGLIHAIRKFDLTRTNKFSSYARWWIKSYIRKFLALNRIIPLHSCVETRMNQAYRFREAYIEKHGKEPSNMEIADGIPANLALKTIQVFKYHWLMKSISLDAPAAMFTRGKDVTPGTSVGDVITSNTNTASDIVEEADTKSYLMNRVKDCLPEYEYEVIRRRFFDNETLNHIAKSHGCSTEAIRLRQNRALVKLRKLLNNE